MFPQMMMMNMQIRAFSNGEREGRPKIYSPEERAQYFKDQFNETEDIFHFKLSEENEGVDEFTEELGNKLLEKFNAIGADHVKEFKHLGKTEELKGKVVIMTNPGLDI